MARGKEIKAPNYRVTNAFVSNMLTKVDKRYLEKIEADAPIIRDLELNGVPFRNKTPLMEKILYYIGYRVSEEYKKHESEIKQSCEIWERNGKENVFANSFGIIILLDFKEIYKALFPDDPKYSGGDIRNIAKAVNDLCSIEDVIVFPLKGEKSIAIRSTLLEKVSIIEERNIFGKKETTGVKVRVSVIFTYEFPKLKSCTFVPTKGITTGARIGKDKLTRHIYNAILYNCSKLHQNAERLRSTAQGIPENELAAQIRKALTYSENFDTIINYKVKTVRYQREHVFIKALKKAAECLKQNGVITEFFITTAANGDKQTNWVINEKFITEK